MALRFSLRRWYLQLQEDGLPVYAVWRYVFWQRFDNWLRIDSNIGRVESIRGGSASLKQLMDQQVSMISKTGKTESGSIASTIGLDFNTNNRFRIWYTIS
jgi:hypothetical protein